MNTLTQDVEDFKTLCEKKGGKKPEDGTNKKN